MRASRLLDRTPPATAVWALAVFGEVPGPLALPGMVCAAAGAGLVRRPRRDRPRPVRAGGGRERAVEPA